MKQRINFSFLAFQLIDLDKDVETGCFLQTLNLANDILDFVPENVATRFSPGAGRSPAPGLSGFQKVGGLPSWSVQLDSPGIALTVGGRIRPGGQN